VSPRNRYGPGFMEASFSGDRTAPPARQLTVGGVIEASLDIYRAHAATLILAGAAVFIVAAVVQAILHDADSAILGLLGSLVSLVAAALFAGFVVNLVADVRDGRRDFTAGELLSSASHAILPLIGFAILFALGVGIGLVLLIVPGLFLMTIWSVGAPAIVVERTGVFRAFGRSHELVRGQGWTVFGAIVTVWLILLVIGFVAAAIGIAIQGVVLSLILAAIVNILTAPVAALVSSVLFFELGGGGSSAPAVPEPAAG
jgi:hypothetical protein